MGWRGVGVGSCRGVEDVFIPGERIRIQSPLTTYKTKKPGDVHAYIIIVDHGIRSVYASRR